MVAVAVVGNVGLHSVDLIGNFVEEHLLAKRLLYHFVVVTAPEAAAVVDAAQEAVEQVAVAVVVGPVVESN